MNHLRIVPDPKSVTCHIVPMYDKHDPSYPQCGYKALVDNKEIANHTSIDELKIKVRALITDVPFIRFVELLDEGEDL